jgi:hypothetical protein
MLIPADPVTNRATEEKLLPKAKKHQVSRDALAPGLCGAAGFAKATHLS